MTGANPYLNFDGNTREAFDFYRSVFGGELSASFTFREAGGENMGISGPDLDRIMHIALPVGGGVTLMGSDILPSLGHKLTVGNNVYIALNVEDVAEAERVFNALKEGGSVEMDLGEVDWAERYGICKDRYGIQWMVQFVGNKTM